MTNQAIIKAELAEQTSAEDLFRQVLNRGKNRDDILAVIAEQPSAALARLNDTQALTDKGSADILDEIVGQIPDAERARELLEQELPAERLRALLLARGDLPSSAAYVVSLDDIVQAVLSDMAQEMPDEESAESLRVVEREVSESALSVENIAEASERAAEEEESGPVSHPEQINLDINSPTPLYVLLGWTLKLKERSDYQEFLNVSLGTFTIKQCVLLAIWYDSGCPADMSEISAQAVDDAGIDLQEAEDELQELFASGPPTFSKGEIEDARMSLAKKRRAQASAPTLVDTALEAAEQAKNEFDF